MRELTDLALLCSVYGVYPLAIAGVMLAVARTRVAKILQVGLLLGWGLSLGVLLFSEHYYLEKPWLFVLAGPPQNGLHVHFWLTVLAAVGTARHLAREAW